MHFSMLSSKIGLLSEFLYSALRSHIVICFIMWIEVVLCFCHILRDTQWTKIRQPRSGNGCSSQPRCHFLPSAVKWADNVDCHVAARNHLHNVLFNILRQLESGNGDSNTVDHVQYRLHCLYRVILSCFDAGIVDERVHCSFHFSLVTDPLFSLQSPSRARNKKKNNLSPIVRQTWKFMCSCFPRLKKHGSMLSFRFWWTNFYFVEQDVEY